MPMASQSGVFCRIRWVALALVALGLPTLALAAARVSQVVPQGEVAEVRQITVRFDSPVVAAGDPRLPAPFQVMCNAAAPAGDGRWLGDREWALDLRQPLAAGQRCSLKVAPGFAPLGGPLAGSTEFVFSTGAPVVLSAQPWPGQRIEEDQHFLLRLNGAPNLATVKTAAWCEVEGLGERIPVRLLEGAAGTEALKQLRRETGPGHLVLLACQRPLPADAKVRLIWGPGIAAADQPQLVSRRAQRYQWQVRSRLLAEFKIGRAHV